MAVLRHYGFGLSFLHWLIVLYDSIQAKIKYYGFESSLFSIRGGTCQGCPLSPLLFILAPEPLVDTIRSNPDLRGVEVAGSAHKVSLFADDILLSLTCYRVSLPNIISPSLCISLRFTCQFYQVQSHVG